MVYFLYQRDPYLWGQVEKDFLLNAGRNLRAYAHVCVYICSCVFLYMHMCVYVCMCVYACIHVCMCGMKLFIWEDNLEAFSPLHHYLQSSERGFDLKYSRSTDLFELNVLTWCRICKEISFAPWFLRYKDKPLYHTWICSHYLYQLKSTS